MKKSLIFILFVFVTSLSPQIFAQTKNDLEFILQVNPIDAKEQKKSSNFTLREVSEFKLMSTGLIRSYQQFISSQDLSPCNFTMSCSHYGMASLQEYGMFHGTLMTSDRLLRCNGTRLPHYSIDPETTLAIDYPLEFYYLLRKSQ